jgi:hypothetical protein
MVEISINIDRLDRFTKKSYVLQHLYQKGAGRRLQGEAGVGELYDGWVKACVQISKTPGKRHSFQREMWSLREQGVVEISRQVPGEGPAPANYYVLTEEYFNFMRNKTLIG